MKIKNLFEGPSKKNDPPKPRNFVAKNAAKTTSGAGAHRDKKKEEKQGYEKHKNKELAEEAAGVGIVTKQNATVDVPVGGEYMNVKKLFPKKKKSKGVAEGNLNEFDPGEGENPLQNYPCYDCGSIIFMHHTELCELAEDNAIRDLPANPGSQHWTGEIPPGLKPIPGLQEGVSEGGIMKSIQRGLKGWQGSSHLDDIQDYIRNASDKTLVRLYKDSGESPYKQTPRDIQIKLINRELKRRYGIKPGEPGVAEGMFDMFKSKPLPKEPETIKLGKFEVELTPGNKYIGFAWKDSTGQEHYEEVSTRGEEFGANNRNELITKIKNEIKYQEKQIKQGVAEGLTTMWEVSFDYGPHMSETVKVEASSKVEAITKAKKLAAKNGYRNIMINWAEPAEQGVAEESELGDLAHQTTLKHRFLVTYSDPNHTMATKRKERLQKHVLAPSTNKNGESVYKAEVEPLVKKHMNKQGLRVHEIEHVGMVSTKVNAQGVKEGSKFSPTDDVVGFTVNSEKAHNVVMRQFGEYIDFDEDEGIMYVPEKMWPKVEMTAFDADGEGATKVDDDSTWSNNE